MRQKLELFQRRCWGNLWETGWSTYGLFWAHRYHLQLNWHSNYLKPSNRNTCTFSVPPGQLASSLCVPFNLFRVQKKRPLGIAESQHFHPEHYNYIHLSPCHLMLFACNHAPQWTCHLMWKSPKQVNTNNRQMVLMWKSPKQVNTNNRQMVLMWKSPKQVNGNNRQMFLMWKSPKQVNTNNRQMVLMWKSPKQVNGNNRQMSWVLGSFPYEQEQKHFRKGSL